MKSLSIIILGAFISSFSSAQNRLSPGFLCSYYGEPVSLPLTVVNSSEDAKRAVAGIMNVVGLNSNFEVKQAPIPNAAAVIFNKKRFILYNAGFIDRINSASGDKWAAIAILAHELGHHLDGHTLSGDGSQPQSELEADEFSGFVLCKMGASLEQAQSAMALLAGERASSTHPAKSNRLLSIDNGWSKADAQMTGRTFTAKIQPVTTRETYAHPTSAGSYTLDPAYITFSVHFTNNDGNNYFITKNNNFVLVSDAKISVLGKLIRSTSAAFPFVIKLKADEFFLLSRDGNLLNKKGNKIGYVKG
ncbi:MAG: hypothetical protein WKF88_07710 [Ferruginibacter sp.]